MDDIENTDTTRQGGRDLAELIAAAIRAGTPNADTATAVKQVLYRAAKDSYRQAHEASQRSSDPYETPEGRAELAWLADAWRRQAEALEDASEEYGR